MNPGASSKVIAVYLSILRSYYLWECSLTFHGKALSLRVNQCMRNDFDD
jgi:hypothetical protein